MHAIALKLSALEISVLYKKSISLKILYIMVS